MEDERSRVSRSSNKAKQNQDRKRKSKKSIKLANFLRSQEYIKNS